jgi:hypothetical protein
MIWFALLIPIAGTLIKAIFFRGKTVWWEYLVEYAVCFALIVGFKLGIQTTQTTDTEYWGSYMVEVWHHEGWNEYHHQTENVYDEDGNVVGTRDTSWVEDHAPCVEALMNTGETLVLETGGTSGWGSEWARKKFPWFEELKGRWTNCETKRHYHSGHTIDGDAFVTRFPLPMKEELLMPVTTKHFWENRIQASSSVFNYPEVSKEDRAAYGLYDYAPIQGYSQTQILGNGGPTQDAAERRLQIVNALLGKDKKVRIYVLIFRNQPIDAAMKQEALWKKGNKNEFVLCLGLNDSNKAQWAHAFSWTKVELLMVRARDYISTNFMGKEREIDLVPVVNFLASDINDKWVKRDFREFSYLSVDPPGWAILLTFFVVLLVDIGLSLWAVLNQFEPGATRRYVRPSYGNIRFPSATSLFNRRPLRRFDSFGRF